MPEDVALKQQPATLNPYITAAWLAGSRLLWDLKPVSWISRGRLRALKNSHAGKKAVILCNGPSLNKVDFELLKKDVFTFGLNKINLLFSRSDFRPSAIVSVNRLVLEQNADFFNTTDIPLFLNAKGHSFIRLRQNVHFLHTSEKFSHFARDCSFSINQGYTVTFVALQLAFHCGFSRVALVGCDHSFAEKGPPNVTVTSGERDSDHFDPNYFAGGAKWQLPDLPGSELFYQLARDTFHAYGRKVVNATEGGKLEIFERVPLETFLRQDVSRPD